jgi:hypothetical protein
MGGFKYHWLKDPNFSKTSRLRQLIDKDITWYSGFAD